MSTRKLKELMKAAEAQFDFKAICVLGPDDGPVRLFVSTDPRERLRVANANCALESAMQLERYGSSGSIDRLCKIVTVGCERQGWLRPGKKDWFNMTAPALVSAIERTAAKCAIVLLTPQEKIDAVFRAQQRAVEKLVPKEFLDGLREPARRARAR